MKVVIVSGHSYNGKDQFSSYCAEHINTTLQKNACCVVHFADILKIFAHQCCDWNGLKDEYGRSMLQNIGDIGRNIQDNFYAISTVAEMKILEQYRNFEYFFIADNRFENEIDTIKQYFPDAITLKVERYNEDGSHYFNPNMTPEQLSHISEIDLDGYYTDWVIENHTLAELKESADFFSDALMDGNA